MSDGVHAQLINELLMKLHETRCHTLKHFNKLFFYFYNFKTSIGHFKLYFEELLNEIT